MTLAFYAVLVYTAWGIDPAVQRAWDAPALDPALLKAIGLILVELLLVTAIALFFSTFSTPMLSAALTFGLFIVGPLQHRPQKLRSGASIRRRRCGSRGGCTGCCRTSRQFDVKSQVVHGQPVSVGYMAMTTGYAALYTAMLLTIAVFVFSRRDFK